MDIYNGMQTKINKMKKLKDEFTFQYQKQTITVKKTAEVHSAIFGNIAKPIKIETTEGVHCGKITTWEGKFLAWLPKDALKEITINDIVQDIKNCSDFTQFLKLIINTEGLELVFDGYWSWLEYNGKEIEGTGKERFTSSDQLHQLLKIAGL